MQNKILLADYEFIEAKPPQQLSIYHLLRLTGFWLSADLHFGHKKVMGYEPIRQTIANTLDDMDEYLIRKWNHMIGIADTVVLLGDVSLCGSARTKELVRRLNGVKFLVVGNHDKSKPLNWWRELFLDAFDTPLKINNVIYSHEPVTPQYLEEHQAIANVHGHTHSKFIDDPRYICVSVEQTYFQPVWRE